MKKKIKDITFSDLNDICLKHDVCRLCPLRITYDEETSCVVGLLYRNMPAFDWPTILKQEVEI